MIFKGVCRKDGGQLAKYLLSSKNEQVRVLDVRGTVLSENTPEGLKSALKDFDELGKMTRGDKTIFHLALNPNDNDRLSKQDWQYAVHKAEEALGLAGHPRAIVSHLYKGKEHLHVAWSRVDVDNAKCVQLSHSNLKLCQAAREVELDLGLHKTPDRNRGMNKAQQLNKEIKADALSNQLSKLPYSYQGMSKAKVVNEELRGEIFDFQLKKLPVANRGMNKANKLNQKLFNVEKHVDERAAKPKEERMEIFTAAWQQSNNGREFKNKIEAAGYQIAIGDRGIVVVDVNRQVYSISRSVEGIKAKEVRFKLSDLENLPTVEMLRNLPEPEFTPPRARNLTMKQFKLHLTFTPPKGQVKQMDHGPG